MIKRQIDSRGQFRGSVIEIKSARLRDVLLEINEGVEDIELSRSDPEVCSCRFLLNISEQGVYY